MNDAGYKEEDIHYTEREFSQWTLYDSNVQSYRSNMIASQSLLLAVTAIFYDKSIFFVIVVSVIGLFHQWYIWFRIIRARTIISDFHKFNALYSMSKRIKRYSDENEISEDEYVKNSAVRAAASDWLVSITNDGKYKKKHRKTRLKLDIIIPITFSIIWVTMIINAIIPYLFG